MGARGFATDHSTMERSVMRGGASPRASPDFGSRHPGYRVSPSARVVSEVNLFRDGKCIINLDAKIAIQRFQRGFTSVQSNIRDGLENLSSCLPHAGQMCAPSLQSNLVCSAVPSTPSSFLLIA